MATELNDRLAPRNISLALTEAALEHCVAASYEPAYGARPLRRWMEHHIITALSRMIIGGELPDSSAVTCDAAGGQLTFSVVAKPMPSGGGSATPRGANGKRPIGGFTVEEPDSGDDEDMDE